MSTEKLFKTSVVSDSMAAFPSLYLEVFVVGDDSDQRAFADMLVRSDCTKAASIDRADLVIFTGGEDVNPALYEESSVHNKTFFNDARDQADIEVWNECIEKGIPMFGVCRGAQFLHVMNGGRLYQDVDGHNGRHRMWDLRNRRIIQDVSSVHHQMVMKNKEGGMETIAVVNNVSSKRYTNATDFEQGMHADIEAFFYRDTCAFGVQGHPEYRGYLEYTLWCIKMIEELIVFNPDMHRFQNMLRMTPDLIALRNQKWAEENAKRAEEEKADA